MLTSYLSFVARIGLAAVFLIASVDKARHNRHFAAIVAGYRILPWPLVEPFAYALPRIEAALGTMLLLGWGTRVAAILLALLLITFSVAMAINIARGRKDLDCGCFGTHHHTKVGPMALARDLLLVLASLLAGLRGASFAAFDALSPALQQSVTAPCTAYLLPLLLAGYSLSMFARLAGTLARLLNPPRERRDDDRPLAA